MKLKSDVEEKGSFDQINKILRVYVSINSTSIWRMSYITFH